MIKYLFLLRPQQWIKNLLLLFPPFFAGTVLSDLALPRVGWTLLAFCSVASCSYLINDIRDVETDRKHETKRNRGLASGEISVSSAAFLALMLFCVSMLACFFVSRWFWLYVILYLLVSLSYTFFLKNLVLVDIFVIALGFVIRVLAGGEGFATPVSKWLFMTVFMVSLFLAIGKRAGELVLMGGKAHEHRRSLANYSISFLEGALWFSASSALVTYSLYTLEQSSSLFYTVPLAAFGLMRYILIVKEGKGDPTEALLKDPQIMGVGIVWAIVIASVIYG